MGAITEKSWPFHHDPSIVSVLCIRVFLLTRQNRVNNVQLTKKEGSEQWLENADAGLLLPNQQPNLKRKKLLKRPPSRLLGCQENRGGSCTVSSLFC